jgi:hypothetical protein
MKDIVVVLHSEAMLCVKQVCTGLSDYEVQLFDPILGDAALAAGLQNVKLFTKLAGPSYGAMEAAAHASALALENELDAAQASDSGVSIAGWQHLNLYYLFLALGWYAGLWERLGPHMGGGRIHVLLNDNPAQYYFNSFIPALTLICHFQERGRDVTAYDYGAKGDAPCRVPDFRGEPLRDAARSLLVHLPTCIYDVDYFRDELRAAGRPIIDLQARLWDTVIDLHRRVPLADADDVFAGLTPALQRRVAAFERALEEVLRRRLAPLLRLEQFSIRQVSHIVRSYRSQLIAYIELHRAFAAGGPAKLVLSQHDAGFQGPLLTFARDRSIPVVLLPHSKVSEDIEFRGAGITCLIHPMQGHEIRDRDAAPVRTLTLNFPEWFTGSNAAGAGLRTLALVLNSQTLNGIPFAPADGYLDGIKRVAAWCAAHGIELKIRCKPGYTLFGLLSVYLGVNADALARNVNEPMDDFVRGCDLCLMYDLPTSGSMYFLRNAIPVLNPYVSELTRSELCLVHPKVILPENLDDTMRRIDEFRAEPSALYAFRDAQFRAYISLFDGARSLRSFL